MCLEVDDDFILYKVIHQGKIGKRDQSLVQIHCANYLQHQIVRRRQSMECCILDAYPIFPFSTCMEFSKYLYLKLQAAIEL